MSLVKNKESFEVCLVTMPYSDLPIPSLALGLLQSVLEKEGIKTKSIYGNLEFCEKIGYEKYFNHHDGSARNPIEEWTFLPTVFPERNSDESDCLKALYIQSKNYRKVSQEQFEKEIREVREAAQKWIRECAEQILSLSPRVVGCSSSLFQKMPSLALLRTIKQLNPDVITLMGGAECETVMGEAIHKHFDWVDFVISGEGEDLIGPLIKQIFEQGRLIPIDTVPIGVFAPLHRISKYPELEGEHRYWAVAESFHEQVIPNFDDYFNTLKRLPDISRRVRPTLPVQASRGCAHGICRFCGLNAPQMPCRYRSYTDVLKEMHTLSGRYKVQHFEFLDNMLEKRYFDNFLPSLVEGGAPYKIFSEIRSNIDKKDFELLRRAGITMCQPGIESLHTSALQGMRKGVAAWHNIQTLKWSRQYGIRIYWSILFGLPDDVDTWYGEMAELIPALMHLEPPKGLLRIEYHRNSTYFENPDQWGLKLRHYPIYDHIYPFNAQSVSNLSYAFEDTFSVTINENPMMKLLFRRKGLSLLSNKVREWIHDFHGNTPQSLFMEDTGEGILIHDTRHIAKEPLIELTGLKAEIYRICDKAVKELDLHETLIAGGETLEDILNALKFLISHHLLLKVDQRFIALALDKSVIAYDANEESPLGWVQV